MAKLFLDVFRSERMQCKCNHHIVGVKSPLSETVTCLQNHMCFSITGVRGQKTSHLLHLSYTMRMFPGAVHDRHWRGANDSTIPLSWSGRMMSGWVLANMWATLIRNFQNFQIFQITIIYGVQNIKPQKISTASHRVMVHSSQFLSNAMGSPSPVQTPDFFRVIAFCLSETNGPSSTHFMQRMVSPLWYFCWWIMYILVNEIYDYIEYRWI